MIKKPRDIKVDIDLRGLTCLEIVDGEGIRQIVKLTNPLALPEPDNQPHP